MVNDVGIEFVDFFHVVDEAEGGAVCDDDEVVVIADQTRFEVLLIELGEGKSYFFA